MGTGNTLHFTRAVGGEGRVPDTELSKQTEIISPAQNLTLGIPTSKNNTAVLPVEVSNLNLDKSYNLTQIGVYADDFEGGEILFFIAQSDIAEEIPSFSVMPDFFINFNFSIVMGNSQNITVNLDSSIFATKRDLTTVIDMINGAPFVTQETLEAKISEIWNEIIQSSINGTIDAGTWDDTPGIEEACIVIEQESDIGFEGAVVMNMPVIDGGTF